MLERVHDRRTIRADHLYAGVPLRYAAIAGPGATIYTAGACPLDENG